MSFDPLLTVLGLLSTATATVPTTFQATAYRGGLAVAPSVLPTNPTVGTFAVDSGDSNALKVWSGSAWHAMGGAAGLDGYVQFAHTGVLASSAGFIFDDANARLNVIGLSITPAALPGTPIAGQLAIDSGASNALKWYNGSAWQAAGGSAGITGSGAATQLTYWTGSSAVSGDNGFVIDTTNHRFGLSDSTALFVPLASLHLSKNTNTGLRADTYSSTAAATAGAQFYRARGTAAAPTAIQTDDVMGFVGAYGYGATGFSNQSRSKIEFKAANTWTDVSQGASLALWTTAVGAVAATERVRLYADGGMQIGGTAANWGTSPGNGVLSILQNQYIAPLTGTLIQVIGGNNVKSRIEIVAFNTSGSGAYATFTGRTSRGNAANPSASQANDIIVGVSACGYGATAWPTTNKGLIHVNAAENWTDAAQGTYIGFDTTATGGVVTSEKVRIWGNGGVQIGGAFSSSPGPGALLLAGAGGGTAGIKCLATGALTPTILTLPTTNGSTGNVLSTDGAGVLSWIATSGTPAGANTQIQYNNAGAFGASAGLTFTAAGTLYLQRTPATAGSVAFRSDDVLIDAATAGDYINALLINAWSPTAGTTAVNQYVLDLQARHMGSNASISGASAQCVRFTAENSASAGTISQLAGLNGSITTASGTTTSFVTGYGVYFTLAGAVTTAYGLNIGGSGAGTVTTLYGIYLNVNSFTATSKYGIYQAGGTAINQFEGSLRTSASTADRAGLRLPHGTAPSAPVDGDLWSTTAGFYGRVNGVTVGPFGAGGGTPAGSDTQIQYNNAGAFGASAEYTFNPTFGLRVARSLVPGDLKYGGYVESSVSGVASSGDTTATGLYARANNTSTGTHGSLNLTGLYAEAVSQAGSSSNTGVIRGVFVNIFGYGSPNTVEGVSISLNQCTSLLRTTGLQINNAHVAVTTTDVYGINIVNSGGSNTYANQYGIKIGANVGTVTTAYALHIDATGGTITNRYGIYQLGAAAVNSFAGLILTPASTTTNAGLRLPHGTTPSAPVDGDFWSTTVGWFVRTNGVSQRVSTGLGVPAAEAGDRTLTDADNGKNLICSGSRTFTVNTGLYPGFGCTFKGTVAFTGTATVTDVRTTGATNPWCALCATGTDTYDIVGSKA